LTSGSSEILDDWLMKALKSSLKPLVQFAEGLFEDYAAVSRASMMTTVSNDGQVEGLNNCLKMRCATDVSPVVHGYWSARRPIATKQLKRQMYGRAGLDLLTKRFILDH
jgi:transposase